MAGKHYLVLLLFISLFSPGFAQMVNGGDTLVGNEWIRYGQPYYAFPVDADGVCRIPYSTLQNAGLGTSPTGAEFRLYSMGRQVPVHVSTDGPFSADDFIEFYGYRNRSEFDRFLFLHPDEDLLNPEHSMYTDRRMYYLTLSDGEPASRVNTLTNDLSNPPSPEAYYLHKESLLFSASLNDPYNTVSGGGAVSYSSYFHGEGFCKASEPNSTTTVVTSNRAFPGPDAVLRIRMTSTNYGNHAWAVTWNDEVVDTIHLFDLAVLDTTYALPLSRILDNNQLKLTAIHAQSRHALVQVDLTYPHALDVSSASVTGMQLELSDENQYIVLDQFAHQGIPPVIYSADGKNRMVAAINDMDQVHFVWPGSQEEKALYITDVTQTIRMIESLERKEFIDYTEDNTEYIIITHPDLMNAGTESEYVQYRSSPAGGSYRAKAYSILDIYDQFGYGIEKHPQSIRNFVEFFHRHWPDAKMIFIIGRGIEYHHSRYPGEGWEPVFFVPTFGRPGADNLLAATLWDLVPRYPIGRLAIFDPEDMTHYLHKVKEHDQVIFSGQSLEEKGWIKNVMHIGGGKTQTEQRDFKATLESLGEDLAQSDYGAALSYFQKESTDPVAESQSNQVLRKLQEGCGIVNYLGHSSASTLEFNISGPVEWNNKGRYPVFSAMGCSAGQIHSNVFSLSDAYVQIPEKGVVAFISGSGSQFANALTSWARPWYNYFGTLHYGATLGESVLAGLQGVNEFIGDLSNSGLNPYRYLLEQRTLQGDPALRFHPLPGPDYTIDRHSVAIQPQVLDTKLDSFDLEFSIANIGRNLRQTAGYRVQLQSPEGEIYTLTSDTTACNTFQTKLQLHLPLLTGGKSGLYRLLIQVDPLNEIGELPAPEAETNNDLEDNLGVEGISLAIFDNLFTASYPADFAIVAEAEPVLIATSSNAFLTGQDVVMELDTHALFTSPLKMTQTFSHVEGPVQWKIPGPLQEGQVYYWRVSADSLSEVQGYNWSRRSFIYLPGSFPGWNQSHFHQLTANASQYLKADSLEQSFEFANAAVNFRNTNRVQDNDLALFPLMIVDGVIRTAFYTGFNTQNVNLFVVAIDPETADYIRNPNPGLYGSINHLNFDAPCFAFSSETAESRQNLINFVNDHIPSGHYVFIYSYQRPGHMEYYPEQWAGDEAVYGQSIFSLIESQYPESNIRSLAVTGSRPFIFLCRKDMGVIEEKIAGSLEEIINVNFDSPRRLSSGQMNSVLIGPAQTWYSLESLLENRPDTSGEWSVSAWALDEGRTDTLWILQNAPEAFADLTHIDASVYPFVQLHYATTDSIKRTPSLVDHWRVFFDGYSDILIRPDLGFEFYNDTLARGELLRFGTYIQNAGPATIDSVTIQYKVSDRVNQVQVVQQVLRNIESWDTVKVEFTLDTRAMSGDYQFVMEVNPGRSPYEINYANNIGIRPFYVVEDDLNPLLDVTFDGVHIRDGDLVSARPQIRIHLHDENEYLRLSDTSLFAVYLAFPSDFLARRLYFGSGELEFFPASPSGENVAIVLLRPDLVEDGIYTLEVSASDMSGNASGELPYAVHFQVIHTPAISHFYNVPNPFSTSTRFLYTLTGGESPPFISLQIFAENGILVREIKADELGPLRVGTHMTEFVWDGTDHTGTRLPVGTYFYKLEVRDAQQNEYTPMTPYWENDFSRNGMGKLIMIR